MNAKVYRDGGRIVVEVEATEERDRAELMAFMDTLGPLGMELNNFDPTTTLVIGHRIEPVPRPVTIHTIPDELFALARKNAYVNAAMEGLRHGNYPNLEAAMVALVGNLVEKYDQFAQRELDRLIADARAANAALTDAANGNPWRGRLDVRGPSPIGAALPDYLALKGMRAAIINGAIAGAGIPPDAVQAGECITMPADAVVVTDKGVVYHKPADDADAPTVIGG